MRYIRSNVTHTEWFVIWSRKGKQDVVVSKHKSYEEAVKACWV